MPCMGSFDEIVRSTFEPVGMVDAKAAGPRNVDLAASAIHKLTTYKENSGRFRMAWRAPREAA
jgi:hypothetical protein